MIADLIRPLREAKERDRERDKEKENKRGGWSVDHTDVSNDATISRHPAGETRETAKTSGGLPSAPVSSLRDEVVSLPFLHSCTSSELALPLAEQEGSRMEVKERTMGGTPSAERSLRVSRRSLREGRSQSLILISGEEDKDSKVSHVLSLTPGSLLEEE